MKVGDTVMVSTSFHRTIINGEYSYMPLTIRIGTIQAITETTVFYSYGSADGLVYYDGTFHKNCYKLPERISYNEEEYHD